MHCRLSCHCLQQSSLSMCTTTRHQEASIKKAVFSRWAGEHAMYAAVAVHAVGLKRAIRVSSPSPNHFQSRLANHSSTSALLPPDACCQAAAFPGIAAPCMNSAIEPVKTLAYHILHVSIHVGNSSPSFQCVEKERARVESRRPLRPSCARSALGGCAVVTVITSR